MNFLITGAAGFIGSALANQLAREGHQVRGLDDLSTGDPQALAPDVHFTRGDVNDRPKLWTLLQEVDCVYHLAAQGVCPGISPLPARVQRGQRGRDGQPDGSHARCGCAPAWCWSPPGAIYGDQAIQPLKESMTPNPRSPYAVSKLAAEYYVRTIGDLWKIETVSLRVFNAYGPGQHLPPAHPPVIPISCSRR